jgi:hypothetical protein
MRHRAVAESALSIRAAVKHQPDNGPRLSQNGRAFRRTRTSCPSRRAGSRAWAIRQPAGSASGTMHQFPSRGCRRGTGSRATWRELFGGQRVELARIECAARRRIRKRLHVRPVVRRVPAEPIEGAPGRPRDANDRPGAMSPVLLRPAPAPMRPRPPGQCRSAPIPARVRIVIDVSPVEMPRPHSS